jgi:hypothetical protein
MQGPGRYDSTQLNQDKKVGNSINLKFIIQQIVRKISNTISTQFNEADTCTIHTTVL